MTEELEDIIDEIEDDSESLDENKIGGISEGELIISNNSAKEVVFHKADRSLLELHNWLKDGDLIIDPEWQRQFVWSSKQSSTLIESFISEIPIPVIYLAEDSSNRYEVIDGLQRLTSVFKYFDGEYKLSGLVVRKDLNGKYFKDLDKKIQSKLKKATVRTFELSPLTSNDLKFIIFERLNKGGTSLNDMEIRNCLYRGRLNNLIKELVKNDDFKTSINNKAIDKRMVDRSLVLRFLAFYERTHHKAKSGLMKFLNDFLDVYKNTTEAKISEFDREFKKCMRACVTVFGNNGFRLLMDGDSKDSEWAIRPNAAIFQVISSSFSKYELSQITRRADAIFEEYLDMVSSDAQWVDYVRRATGQSGRLTYVFDTWEDRLKKAIGNEEPNDGRRIFSKKLKEEMYAQNNTCSICGNSIKTIKDSALDHEKHYWRGGKTVPDNARLAHRLCNMKRNDNEII